MSVGVAAHPEVHPASASRESDRQHLAAKLEVADFAITQFFFDPNDYHRLIDELDDLGCNKPIIPGIMLFGSAGGLARMAALNNATIPEKLANRLERTAPADMGKLALDTALDLVEGLGIDKVPGLHIYTLNKSQPALDLERMLG
jgi:methylenetetrahydrofolate reductase (NADPH)